MNKDYEYDFAVSYAGPDQPFVEQVVSAMKARGMRVFFAPDEQAEIIGRNLIDYLSDVYLAKARYCLVFVSNHYVERKWTDRVERPAAQARALEQKDRYIIPVRLDDAEVPGILSTTAYIRRSTPKQIADLAVSLLLRDESPAARSDENPTRDHLILRVVSFTEFDADLLRESFKPFAGWVVNNAHMIPVELRLPRFLMDTLASYADILNSSAFQQFDANTREHFTRLVAMIRTDLFNELLRVPSSVLGPSQPYGASSFVLTDSAVDLIRRYVLAKVIAAARCLVTWQLKGFAGPSWARHFADCDQLWTPHLMGGLPWLCRSEGLERHLWLDADVIRWGPGMFNRVRIYLPSLMVLRRDEKHTADEVLHFVAPQLLERQLDGRLPYLLHEALNYPERMEVSNRNESVLESHHFHEIQLNIFNWKEALPAMESLRDEIMEQYKAGTLARQDAIMRMYAAGDALGNHGVFASALNSLYSGLDFGDSNSTDQE